MERANHMKVNNQLRIFEVLGEQFDLNKASFNKHCDGTKGCVVKAYIPNHVIFPGDDNYSRDFGADDPWLQYIAAMHRAYDTFKLPFNPSQMRDEQRPVNLLILREASFKPEYVIKYLK